MRGGYGEMQRNGPVGTVPLTFLRTITRFEDRAPDHADGGA